MQSFGIYPLSLSRPQLHEIDVEAFERMWPAFGGAHPLFVRNALSLLNANRMFHNVKNTRVLKYFDQEEPQECEVSFNGPIYNASDVASHVLAVKQGRRVKLFPVHEMIFAANCATLPYFPYSPSLTGNPSNQFTLPVVELEVPSLDSFRMLHEYLYTKDIAQIRENLTPSPLAQNIPNLCLQTTFIHDLWKNACALGVLDINLYNVLEDMYIEAQNAMRRIEALRP